MYIYTKNIDIRIHVYVYNYVSGTPVVEATQSYDDETHTPLNL
jgi:hypothetical protein